MLEKLRELGVEVDKVLVTLNGKQALYEKLIFKFYDLVKESNVTEDMTGDFYERVHALKGASGNLGIQPLFEQYVRILALLREEKTEQVAEVVREMLPIQEQILSCIEEYRE